MPLHNFMQALAEHIETTFQEKNGVYSIDIPFVSGRKQRIYAFIKKTKADEDVIICYTIIGKYTKDVDAEKLLRLNLEPIYTRISIYENDIILFGATLLDSADIKEVLVILKELAAFGDTLERELFGTDIY